MTHVARKPGWMGDMRGISAVLGRVASSPWNLAFSGAPDALSR
jgi:hypothetical protein